jgi:hypothetical protein
MRAPYFGFESLKRFIQIVKLICIDTYHEIPLSKSIPESFIFETLSHLLEFPHNLTLPDGKFNMVIAKKKG